MGACYELLSRSGLHVLKFLIDTVFRHTSCGAALCMVNTPLMTSATIAENGCDFAILVRGPILKRPSWNMCILECLHTIHVLAATSIPFSIIGRWLHQWASVGVPNVPLHWNPLGGLELC